MRLPLHRLAGLATATLLLASAGTAQAQGKGHGKGHDKEYKHAVRGDERRRDDDDDRDERRRDDDDDRDERRVSGDERRDDRRVYGERRDERRDDRRVYDSRGDYDPRYVRGRKVPPGLAKKPGGMPPGQYKKLYSTREGASVLSDVLGRRGYPVVRSTEAGSSEYVYYRDRNGQLRRAIVSPGNDRLRFSNVPSSLLSEVLSRMY